MYRIIGADQKEYGPITADQIKQWIAEGRVNGQTSTKAEGVAEWAPLSTLPEFAEALRAKTAPVEVPQGFGAPPVSVESFPADYDLDIGGCIANGWDLLKNNFGLIFGGVAIYMLIAGVLIGLGSIPFIGPVFGLCNLIVSAPLLGGVYYFLLKNIRRQPTDVGNVFSGFRLAFGQLLLGYIVSALLSGLAALPGLAIMGVPVFIMSRHHSADPVHILIALAGFIVFIVPLMYLSVSWMFSLPLIIDKRMSFWPAMAASRKQVGKHWWVIFGLLVLIGLVNFAGVLACCVGLFITVPITFAALMYAYETLFSASGGQTA